MTWTANWIATPTSIVRNPRTKRLGRLLGISKHDALGRVIALQCWAFDFARDGDLSTQPDDAIADAVEWLDDPEVFVRALTDSGWLDAKRGMVGWYETAGRLFEDRQKDAERKKTERAKARPPDVPRTSAGHPQDVRGTSGTQDKTRHDIEDRQDRKSSASGSATRVPAREAANDFESNGQDGGNGSSGHPETKPGKYDGIAQKVPGPGPHPDDEKPGGKYDGIARRVGS